MADIAVTGASVGPVFPDSHTTVIRNFTCLVDVTVGQTVYVDPTTGKVGLCDANDTGKEQFAGVALATKKAGETVRVQQQGEIYGFTLAGSYAAIIFQGDTAGAFADAASGTKTVQCGKIVPLNDSAKTKVLYIQADRLRNW